MKRTILIALALLAVCAPFAAAKVVDLGAPSKGFLPGSKCPGKDNPGTENDTFCEAVYQVTGYQERAPDTRTRPYVIRRKGKILAFTVKLGRLTQEQIDFFDGKFGENPTVRLSVLRQGKKRKRSNHRVVAKSEVFDVGDKLGTSPTLVLKEPLEVERGNIVALTIPTWVPALATGQETSTFWRSSRRKGRCGTTGANGKVAPAAPQGIGQLIAWGCNYKGAQLLYTATYVPENRTTKPAESSDATTARSSSARELGTLGGGALAPAP